MSARVFAAGAAMALASCGGGALVPAVPTPVSDSAPSVAVPVATAARVTLPLRLATATWRVQSLARVKVSGGGVSGAAAEEQRVESTGLVSWTIERQRSGALRASGQVDSFTVRTTFDAQRGLMLPATPAVVLLEATLDSALARVITRPPLVNECDRPEAGAASLARDLLVRIPNGAAEGERWRDSSVTLVCRSSVPMTVYTTTQYRLERLGPDKLVVRRDITSRLEGRGGSSFRSLELAGTATGVQTVEIGAAGGAVERLDGTSTLTLQATERTPGNAPRVQQVVQRTETRAVRHR